MNLRPKNARIGAPIPQQTPTAQAVGQSVGQRRPATPPPPQQVPPGAQPGMTPISVDPSALPQAPPPESTLAYQPPVPEPTGTVLDRLTPLMEPQIWQTFLALVTYAQLVDDLERGDAKMTPQYQGSVVAAFGVGFGPPHLWQAMQGDTSKFALRIIDRWFMDEDYRAAGGSLCWQFIDWFAPGFCAISKGLEAKQQCLQILKEIKQDFV